MLHEESETSEPQYSIPERVLRLRKYHHLIDSFELMGMYALADSCRIKAFDEGVKIVTQATENKNDEESLDKTLGKLKKIDREMHGVVTGVLRTAQATIEMQKMYKKPR